MLPVDKYIISYANIVHGDAITVPSPTRQTNLDKQNCILGVRLLPSNELYLIDKTEGILDLVSTHYRL